MKNPVETASALCVLFGLAAVALGQDVRTGFDKHANFERYHT